MNNTSMTDRVWHTNPNRNFLFGRWVRFGLWSIIKTVITEQKFVYKKYIPGIYDKMKATGGFATWTTDTTDKGGNY